MRREGEEKIRYIVAYREHRNSTNFPFLLLSFPTSLVLPSALINAIRRNPKGININEKKAKKHRLADFTPYQQMLLLHDIISFLFHETSNFI